MRPVLGAVVLPAQRPGRPWQRSLPLLVCLLAIWLLEQPALRLSTFVLGTQKLPQLMPLHGYAHGMVSKSKQISHSIRPDRRQRVARQVMFIENPAVTLLGAVAAFLGFQFLNADANGSALRDFITENTNIRIVDVSSDADAEGKIASGPTHKPVIRGDSVEAVHWYVDGKGLSPVHWYIRKSTVLNRVLSEGGLGFAESYMDGEWDTDDLERLTYEMLRLEDRTKELGWRELPLIGTIVFGALRGKLLPMAGESVSGAEENIGKTYDDDTIKIYERMCGKHMQYSCGWFYRPEWTLDEAQRAKMDLVATKLDLKPGMKLLEIGFGFGSLANYLASKYDVQIVGCTLSRAQRNWAQKHNAHPNVEFRYSDYRKVEGKFDRVYSVGMFEHVGRASFETYFNKVYDVLKDDGIFLLHTMGWAKRGEWNHNAFVSKYIFPNGELPTQYLLAEEFSDKWHLEDWQSFGKSYVQTLRCWLDNIKTWEGMDEFDTSVKRMWEYYLACCAAAFEKRRTKVWQIVYTKQLGTRLNDCYHIRAPGS